MVTRESPAQRVEGGRALGEGQHAVSVAVKQQEHLLVVQLQTKVHRKVRNHGEGPYKGIFLVETLSHSPSRGLLCDCEIFANLRLTFV